LTKTYSSFVDASRDFGLAANSIQSACKRKSWYSITANIGSATAEFHDTSNNSYVEYNIFTEDGKAVKKLDKTGTVFKNRDDR